MTSDKPTKDGRCSGARAVLAIALLGLLVEVTPASAQDGFRVIVNAELTGGAVKRQQVAALFLSGAGRWGSTGSKVEIVDQSLTSAVRGAFSRHVLKMEPRSVLNHWKRRIHERKGRPPKVKTSDAEVIEFVASKAGGIGYVSDTVELPTSVRVLEVVE